MKIYSKVVVDIGTGHVVEKISADYTGPLALADSGGQEAPDMGPSIRVQSKQNRFMRQFLNRIYTDEAPFRELNLERARFGAGFQPELEEQILSPELSPGFEKAYDTGMDKLRSSFAASGSPSSGPAQVAGAEFTTNLLNAERARQQENLFRGAGFQSQPVQSQAPQVLGPLQQGVSSLSDLYTTKAGYDAQAANQQSPWMGLGGQIGGQVAGAATPWLLTSLFSSEKLKQDISKLTAAEMESIFEDVEAMPVYRWKYKPEVDPVQREHIGPTVEKSPEYIRHSSGLALEQIDINGMLLTALKVLARRVRQLEKA